MATTIEELTVSYTEDGKDLMLVKDFVKVVGCKDNGGIQ